MRKTLGVIVNPIAGMGGRVGLKGTDGRDALRRARELGAEPGAAHRAVEALCGIAAGLGDGIDVVAPPHEMGEDEARACGMDPRVVGTVVPGATTPEDTKAAARNLRHAGVDLLLFAGGDGTARDIYDAIGDSVPAVGIPAGVKMHSAVYATSPRAGADLAVRYLRTTVPCREAEVMDIDEDAFRHGAVSAKLYGYLRVPDVRDLVQGLKVGSTGSERSALAGIAADVAERMDADGAAVSPGDPAVSRGDPAGEHADPGMAGSLYILGPGTTTKAIRTISDWRRRCWGST